MLFNVLSDSVGSRSGVDGSDEAANPALSMPRQFEQPLSKPVLHSSIGLTKDTDHQSLPFYSRVGGIGVGVGVGAVPVGG
jgi:hypothetical protein